MLLVLLSALLLAGCHGVPEQKTKFTAVKVPAGEAVAVDAGFWKNAPSYELLELPKYVKRNPVTVQFAWDDEALYFRFEAVDDDIVDESPENQKNSLQLFADCLELFIRPQNSRGYWEFHFTAGGHFGGIHFPARGRRMPSDVVYRPMNGLEFKAQIIGTLNDFSDKDDRWIGLARIPFAGIADRCAPFSPGEPLLFQVTSVAYSAYADWDEMTQLTYIPETPVTPHYLPAWGLLEFKL